MTASTNGGDGTAAVLVVDDSSDVRALLDRWLRGAGYAPLLAEDAAAALRILEDHPVAVALCDIRLPGEDGFWLSARLLSTHPDVAVVMATGIDDAQSTIDSMRFGAVDYVVKPFVRDRLIDAVARAFQVHRSRRAAARTARELEKRRDALVAAHVELEQNNGVGLRTLLKVLELRCPLLVGHARRVSQVAVNLAMMLEVVEPALTDVEHAALLQDVGRVALPDDLLTVTDVPGREPARTRFCAHPIHAQQILQSVPSLLPASALVVAASERFDGNGYPYGLRGNQIPLGARIIAVASAFDRAVYGFAGEATTHGQALRSLNTERCPEFDPRVLEALTALMPEPLRRGARAS